MKLIFKNPAKIWGKFQVYGQGDQNFRVARLALRNMRQITQELKSNEVEIETFDAYTCLRLQAVQCGYKVVKAEGDTNSEIASGLLSS